MPEHCDPGDFTTNEHTRQLHNKGWGSKCLDVR
nr:hypothetical protein [Wolbachia endosymbiont of Dirofilaria (Dirofilaria) immitis]